MRFFFGLAGLLLARLRERPARNEVRDAANVVQAHTINGDVTFCHGSRCRQDDRQREPGRH
ncbi:hypothetical protein [Allokutzneria oryzae]|uniref:Secreted protein n=1 Tax=Allokutzneria oryzae TaxID=1378989 RepID=A0ABV6A2Q3_9PSEU